jgi:hypothetical protein
MTVTESGNIMEEIIEAQDVTFPRNPDGTESGWTWSEGARCPEHAGGEGKAE